MLLTFLVLSTGSCLYQLGGIPHLNHTKITQQYGCVMNLPPESHSTVVLNVVNVIQEGVSCVIHRIWIRLEVIRIGLQVKLRVTGLRVLRLRVRLRAKIAKWLFITHVEYEETAENYSSNNVISFNINMNCNRFEWSCLMFLVFWTFIPWLAY